jgi:glycosyltransferase involved in cell wall biosynthesis
LSALGSEPSRVVPNFIGDLPDPPVDLSGLDGLPTEPFILYFGDVTVDKGARVLAEAYRSIEGAPPLVMIGRPILEPELKSVPGLVLLGRRPHAVAIEALRRALFSVVPTILPETFGIVALEAGAAGKAVIASDVGGLPDVVLDGETGLLAPPGKVGGLRQAIERLLADPALRERMGEAGRQRVRQVFSPDAVVPMFEQAYEEAIERRRTRS